MEAVQVVVAYRERATLRVGDVFLKVDADQTRTDVEVEAMAMAPIPTPAILWRKPPQLRESALRAAERFAVAHPDDPDLPDLLECVRRYVDAHLRWGRETLGWCIDLFRAPA